jgi:hypothetical protein
MSVTDSLVLREPRAGQPLHPLQRRYREIAAEIRQLRKEQREIKDQMQSGICETCGEPFVRNRVTKRFCSQACIVKEYTARTPDGRLNLSLVREMWPLLVQSGQLTPRTVTVLNELVNGRKDAAELADHFDISRQRIDQMMGRAAKVAKLLRGLQAVVRSNEGVTHG